MPGNILIITFIAIITHGWIFLSNAEIWDGWYVRDWIKNGHLDYLARYYQEAGHPFFGWVHLHANWFSNVSLFYHFLAFGSLLGTALGVYWILTAKNLFTQNERLWLAIFVLVYPGFLVTTDSVVTLYLVCYFLFILGWCLLLLSHQEKTSLKFLYRISSLGLFFLSFFTNSLLVFYYAFLAIWFFLDFRDVRNFIARYWIFVIWPLVFWGWSKTTVKRAPIHQNYYQLNFSWDSIYQNFVSFFTNVLGTQLHSPIVKLAVFAMIYFSCRFLLKREKRVQHHSFVYLLASAMLLVAALLPYTVIKQGFGLEGWVSKNNLLVALPLGLVFVIWWSWNSNVTLFKWETIVVKSLPAVVIGACTLEQVANYLRYEALEGKLQAVANFSETHFSNSPFSIIYLKDSFFIRGTNQTLPPLMWSCVVNTKIQNRSTILVQTKAPKGTHYNTEEIKKGIEETFVPYAFEKFDNQYQQINLSVLPGDDYKSAEVMGAKFLWFKLSGSSTDFFKKFVNIQTSTGSLK